MVVPTGEAMIFEEITVIYDEKSADDCRVERFKIS
jgi:hypothetical protein